MTKTLPPKLPHARYIVLHHDGAWKINLNNSYYGPFATQAAAVESATATARHASEGRLSCVGAVDEGHRVRDAVDQRGGVSPVQ